MSEGRAKQPPERGNSRESAELAGWRRDDPGREPHWERLLEQRRRTRWGNFSWVSPAPLLASVNDKVAAGLDDVVNAIRPRWVAVQRERTKSRLMLVQPPLSSKCSFLVLGDPGEQDASQYAVVKPLLEVGRDTDFMVIDSDVIYPAGDINDYLDGFYMPYRDYQQPIYAIPGNHDWYDGLNGFMWHFCSAEPLSPVAYRTGGFSWKQRMARFLWRKPSPPANPQLMMHERARLHEGRAHGHQPGPYFCIRIPARRIRDSLERRAALLLVCIDTGITGTLDREQGEWLREVSALEGPKVLITGKPIYFNGKYHAGEIAWGDGLEIDADVEPFRTVDAIVRHPDHDYRAVIGGDIHNYQRYSVTVEQASTGGAVRSRRVEYIVSGGGGAYLSATHAIPKVHLTPTHRRAGKVKPVPVRSVTEDDFRCYPLRGDSLARFIRRASVAIGLVLLAALLIVVASVLGLLALRGSEIQKFDVPVGEEGGGWTLLAFAVVVSTILFAAGLAGSWMKWIRKIGPARFRAASATVLTLGLLAAILALTSHFLADWDNLIWKMVVATVLAVVLPVAGVAGYYLARDFLGSTLRLLVALVIPLGLAVTVLLRSDPGWKPSVIVAVALFALWLGVMLFGKLRDLNPTPETKPGRRATPEQRKAARWRRRGVFVGRLTPLGLALASIGVALFLVRDHSWIPVALPIALWGILLTASVLVLFLGRHGVKAGPYLFSRSVDPDETARWLADRLQISDPVRPAARSAKVSQRTRLRAGAIYDSPLRKAIAELAEATRPPFFKSFLRAELDGDRLTIRAYGVSGLARDEESPTLEDEVEIDLSPRG